ncbi:MAG: hypothetical protein AAF620_00120 [Bacteroidota bacterium]
MRKCRIILAGKAASGKEYMRDFLTAECFILDISVTTRPQRMGEVNGVVVMEPT